MSVTTHKISDGFVISDEGTWIPGVYDTENAAIAAAGLSPESVQAMWDQVLASGRDTATMADVERAK